MIQNKVGHNLFVWSRNSGSPSDNSHGCIITAHGRAQWPNKTYRGPDVELVYYARHGCTLLAPAVHHFVLENICPVEKIRSNASFDYILSKHTNSYTTGGTIHNTINENYNNIKRIGQYTQSLGHPMLGISEEHILTYANLWKRYDVVTLRNRSYRTRLNPLSLSEVISTLWIKGYTYPTVHCLFCRGFGPADS